MNFIKDNLKQAGIFNAILIAIAIVLEAYILFTTKEFISDYLFSISIIVALVFGLFYSINGYQKNAAKYYKLFMNMCVLAYFLSAASDLFYIDDAVFGASMITTYASFVRLIPIAILAFARDYGNRNSLICAYVVFLITLFIFIRCIVVYSEYSGLIIDDLSQLVLSGIIVVFVAAKYEDKDARGTE